MPTRITAPTTTALVIDVNAQHREDIVRAPFYDRAKAHGSFIISAEFQGIAFANLIMETAARVDSEKLGGNVGSSPEGRRNRLTPERYAGIHKRLKRE